MRCMAFIAAVLAALWTGAAETRPPKLDELWKDVEKAEQADLPRTATNLLSRIYSEAVAAKRGPDAVRAFVRGLQKTARLDDRPPASLLADWIARADAAPAELRGPLHASILANRSFLDGLSGDVLLHEWDVILGQAEVLKRCRREEWDPGCLIPSSVFPTLLDAAAYALLDGDAAAGEVRRLLDLLADAHRDDEQADARAYVALRRIKFEHERGNAPSEEREKAFLRALDAYLAEYLDVTSVATEAAKLRVAAFEKSHDVVAAHDLARACATRWPELDSRSNCSNVVARLERRRLAFKVERTWCRPWPEIELESRNITNVTFRLVPVPFGLLAEKGCLDGKWDVSDPDNEIARLMRRPVSDARTWAAPSADVGVYAVCRRRCPVPTDLKPGHYFLFAFESGGFEAGDGPVPVCRITVSDLALVSWEVEDGDVFLGRVFTAEEGVPVGDADVELWTAELPETGVDDEAKRPWRKCGVCRTSDDGTFELPLPENQSGCVRVLRRGQEALMPVVRHGHEDAVVAPDPGDDLPSGFITLIVDRAIYRPEQSVQFKGVVYRADAEKRDFRTLGDVPVTVELVNSELEVVATASLRTTAWGSFHGSLEIPADGRLGRWRVRAKAESPACEKAQDMCVEEYRRPRFRAEMDCEDGNVRLGAPVRVTGTAATYSSAPVPNAKVSWRVERQTTYAPWWEASANADGPRDEPQFVSGETRTDAGGAFEIVFTPLAPAKADLSGEPVYTFTLTAEIVDGAGETHVLARDFRVGAVAWKADLAVDDAWPVAGVPIPVDAALGTHGGSPVQTNGVLSVYALEQPAKLVRGAGTPDWSSWKPGACVLKLPLSTDAGGACRTNVVLAGGAYSLEFAATDPQGRTTRARQRICVIDPARCALRVPDYFRLEKHRTRAGEKLRFHWASGYATGTCRLSVSQQGETLFDEQTDLARPSRIVEFPVGQEHVGKGPLFVEAEFFRENRLYYHCEEVSVDDLDTRLVVDVEGGFPGVLEPGTRTNVTLCVTTPDGRPAADVELAVWMYDRSLDALAFYAPMGTFWGFGACVTHVPLPPCFAAEVCGSQAVYEPPCEMDDDAEAFEVCVAVGDAFGSEVEPHGGAPFGEGRAVPRCEVPARRNLRETAFFLPELRTDAEGRATFSFTAPEALTSWSFRFFAHDRNLRSMQGHVDDVVTWKPLMVEPGAPRFAREGDGFLFPVKVMNDSDEPLNGVASLAFADAATGRPVNVGGGERTFALEKRSSTNVFFSVKIPDGQGGLGFVAGAQAGSHADGEEGRLPVLSRRVRVEESVALRARGGETRTFALSNLLASARSDTLRHAELSVEAASRPAWYAVLSLPYLMEFPHECYEQKFSRYYANALAAHVVNADPRVRAVFDRWRKQGAEATRRTGAGVAALFDSARLAKEQARCLAELKDGLVDGLWPWFPGGHPSEAVTLRNLTGCARLKRMADIPYPDFFANACQALDARVLRDVNERRRKAQEENAPFMLHGLEVRWLYLHSFAETPPLEEETWDVLLAYLEDDWKALGFESRALAATVLVRLGRPEKARAILASLREHAFVSAEGDLYWSAQRDGYAGMFRSGPAADAAIVEAFLEAGDADVADMWRARLIDERRTRGWDSTVSTADAAYALMLGGGDLLFGGETATVTLDGAAVPKTGAEAETGHFMHRYAAEEVRPWMGSIGFTGAGREGMPSWGGVHWSYDEDVLRVRAHETGSLKVEKHYFRKVRAGRETRLEPVAGPLALGDEVVVRLVVTSDGVYDYVHLEDARPACLEPVDVSSGYRWQGGPGHYQETRDTATHYYYDRIGKGRFTLETSFRVRQAGSFSGGIATLQCMYAPAFTAHSDARKLEVSAP